MLVLHPRISTVTDCMGANVTVSDGVGGVNVKVGLGRFVLVGVTGVRMMTPGVSVASKVGGGMIKGVAVTILGVFVETGVQTGKGCGGTPHVSQAEMKSAKNSMTRCSFMCLIIPPVIRLPD